MKNGNRTTIRRADIRLTDGHETWTGVAHLCHAAGSPRDSHGEAQEGGR